MQPTPHSERIHIALFGRCNSGKSSLMNALTGQEAAIVSPQAGTTTDTVQRAMELPGLGAVLLIDTPGLDDLTALAEERMRQSRRTLDRADLALLLFTDREPTVELDLLEELRSRRIPTLLLLSQSDRLPNREELARQIGELAREQVIPISSTTGEGLEALRKGLAALRPKEERLLTEGLCKEGDIVLLVMPQDASAPKGRLIQPQVQTLRELLDRHCQALCCTPEGMERALASLQEAPKLIITDSQVFDRVHRLKPEGSALTSFSVLMARYKGDISTFVEGAKELLRWRAEGRTQARILIAEACTHTPQNEDIGRVKLPRMLRKVLSEEIKIDHVGGRDFPEDLSPYDLVIHCGACMFNRQLVMSRIGQTRQQATPITNYGIAIAALQGILDKIVY